MTARRNRSHLTDIATTKGKQMETIKHAGRTFRSTEESRFAVGQIQWAEGILSRPNVRFPNGRQSHEAANEVIEQNEDALIDYLCIVVLA